MTWRQHAAAVTVSVGRAILHTWPLAGDVGGLSRLDNADTARLLVRSCETILAELAGS